MELSHDPQQSSVANKPPSLSPARRSAWLILGPAILVICLVVAAAFAGYAFGLTRSKQIVDQEAPEEELQVPKEATVIAECAKGRGKQYVLAKDIPHGPVYNVYQNKVIGLEFMVGKNDLLQEGKNFLNLNLFGRKYDHVNIGLLSSGHAGFPEPHYHVDLFLAPASIADAITCEPANGQAIFKE